jgi:Plasmid pRiA4b ORF-3-like protein
MSNFNPNLNTQKMKIYQLKITLVGSKPPIWRRFLVKSDTLLSDLHLIIQTTMGWTNSHLHQFIIGNDSFQPDYEGMDDDGYSQPYTDKRLNDFLKKENSKFVYEYDFGDSWNHEIVLEKVLEEEKGTFYPVCTDGKNACPVEDCGGIWGYEDLVKVLKNKKHPEHEEMKEWVGLEEDEDFDPTEFDKEYINEGLKSENFGVLEF